MTLTTNKHQHLFENAICHFDKSSTGLTSSLTIWLISDTELSTLSCQLEHGIEFNFYKIAIDNTITTSSQLTLVDLTSIENGGKWLYKIPIVFTSEAQGLFTDYLTVTADSIATKVKLSAEAEALDETLAVLLQNFKKWVSDEYIVAFRETQSNATAIDWVVYNKKLKEYLLNIFDFTALTGSYRHLLRFIEWFGYGDLLSLKEYWKSDEAYKSTAIGNQVLTKIEKHLSGFEKTNQMSLVYQINEQDGVDEDGLPTYVNVLDETDKILLKLWTLQRILERDILSFNTHIVDIVGEVQSAIGLEMSVILNDADIWTIALTDNVTSRINWSYVDTSLFIERHTVLLEPFVFAVNEPNIEFLPNLTIGQQSAEIFDILNASVDDMQDFDLLTSYYSGDFGLIEMHLEFDSDRYQSYKYVIQDVETDDFVFVSELYDISKLANGRLWCGCKRIGKYRLTLYLIDWYGAPTIIGTNETITIDNRPVDIVLGRYSELAGKSKDLRLWSTFVDTTNETFSRVVDNLSVTFDINTWNPDTNTPAMQIARLYESDFDMWSTWTNLNQLNSIPLYKLDGIPLHVWGSTYATSICDLIGNGTVGTKVIKLKESVSSVWLEFEKDYDGVQSDISWLTELVSSLNQLPSGTVWSDFTYDVHWYSDEQSGTINTARPMLRLRAKESSYRARLFDIDVETIANADFADQKFKHDVQLFSQVDAKLQFAVIAPATGEIVLRISDQQWSELSLEINTISDLIAWIVSKDLADIVINLVEDTALVYSKQSVTISHPAIGMQADITRGVFSSKIVPVGLGSDFRLGEPVFAFIDSDKRLELRDLTWTLTNTLTGAVVTTQHAYSFRWILSEEAVYTLTLTGTDYNGQFTTIKQGAIIIQ